MHWLAVDPGETTGFAVWKGTEQIEAGQLDLWSFIDAVDEWLSTKVWPQALGNPGNASGHQERDIAYLAGLIDGEGCISVNNNGTLANGDPQRRALIQVGMSTPAPLEWAAQTFGGKVNGPYARKDGGQAMYHWNHRAAQTVANLLGEIRPFLQVKGEDASRALAFLAQDKGVEPNFCSPLGAIVCEEWALYPWMLEKLAWDKCRTARGIGSLELLSRRFGIPIILQGADIKDGAMAAGAEALFLQPAHENRHANDATMHGVFYTARHGRAPC